MIAAAFPITVVCAPTFALGSPGVHARTAAGGGSGRLIAVIKPGSVGDAAAMPGVLASIPGVLSVRRLGPVGIEIIECESDVHAVRAALSATGRYEAVVHDERVMPLEGPIPSDPLFDQQWHLSRCRVTDAWASTTGNSMVIAMVDTGIDVSHPDLAATIVPGYKCADRLAQADGGAITDINGHGTLTAGVAAAVGNNGVGVAGVAWTQPVMPVRATNSAGGGAYLSDVYDGVIWAVRNGARIVVVGYAGVQSPGAQTIGAWATSAGAILIWPMDNAGVVYDDFDWPDVFVVTGTTREDRLSPSSSSGLAVDLVAPGSDIYTTERGGTFGPRSGNSFVGPQVAAAASLVWSMDPSMTPRRVVEILTQTARDLGPPGPDPSFGAGLLDAAAAVRLASVADFDRDGFIDFHDYDGFMIAFESGDPRADADRNGFVDWFDLEQFLRLFEGE